MIKDIKYFIDYEEQFIKNHPNYGEPFYDETIDEMSSYGVNDRLNYLSDKVISNAYKLIKVPLGKEIEFGFSDAQKVLFRLFYGKHSQIFRDDYYYDEVGDFAQNLFDTFDDAVRKAPINTDSILYRFCNEHDKCNMKTGDIIEFPFNLTCTNYDWKQEHSKNVYLITPLKDGKTRAHNLFDIYKNGDENQVDFLRHTKFKVTGIENTDGTEHKKIYLEELPFK